jgi:pimeloyl-ACP methyl ester carboxylesterase
MPKLTTDDGVQLYYEEAGVGVPVVFVHEFGGDHRSWEPQVRHFSRRYRCIAYNARGYPPSDVPEDFERYSQARARDDIRAVLDALKIDQAHVVGLSMGAFATLHFGMAHGKRALSITVAGGGYGSHPAQYRQFQADSKKNADVIRSQGMKHFVATYGRGPQRVQLEEKDPRGFAEYVRQFEEHSPLGAANTLLGVQNRRPSFYDLTAEMALAILPRSGHAINLEEPALFNQLVESFFHQVEAGRWGPRDPRSTVPSIYGPSGKP